MLIHFGVIPYIVFDGDYLPGKAATEAERAKRREESRRKGLELYRLNKFSQAHLELQKAVEVTPEMARQFIDELKKIDVQYLVSPYEADAQLAYLERKGIIRGMLSEDSDLLVFGANRLLTKLDQYGDCIEINRADFTACRDISLVGWSDAEFRRMAILSGCDYLASISRMGLKSAYRYVRKYKKIEKILQMLAFDGQYHVPTGYLEKFYKAELTFLHQRVFCPLKNDIVMMTDLVNTTQPEDLSFIGGKIERNIAIGVAKGDLDPMTKQPITVKAAVKAAPRPPWSNSCKDAVGTSSDTKANRSIDSFFKAKRTPLAELDPNSFRPSPTQQRLLEQANGNSWEPSPAPAGPPRLQSSMSVLPSAKSTTPSSSTSRALTDLASTLSGQNPPKRRRLCADPVDSQDLGNVALLEGERSHFFTTNIADPSLSAKKSRSRGRRKEADITIWSDDSIEDAMAELSKSSEEPKPEKTGKLDVFKDLDPEKPAVASWTNIQEKGRPKDDSQSSMESRATEMSEISTSTEATSVTSSIPSVAQTMDQHVSAELKALAATYSYQPETDKMRSQREHIANTIGRSHSNVLSQLSSKPQLYRQRSMTPLQQLGLGALNRPNSCSGSLNDRLKDAQSKRNAPKANSNSTNQIIQPSATVSKGSEDAIIPDSEDSGDDILSQTEEFVKAKINLGRFAFDGYG